jgi:hypothetical protein
MAQTTISSPVKDFTGSTYIGPTVLDFKDGKATTDVTLSAGTIAYLEKRGYKIGEAPAEDEGPFNPVRHNVDEVQAYLADADEAERTRVLDAEKARGDKARKTIVEWEPPAPAGGGQGDGSQGGE